MVGLRSSKRACEVGDGATEGIGVAAGFMVEWKQARAGDQGNWSVTELGGRQLKESGHSGRVAWLFGRCCFMCEATSNLAE